ncbi:MAG: hypothetical protein M1482_12935 [Chloroflexi bacterium]|nr:hypothetical protein [Chloroflexota bacterium]
MSGQKIPQDIEDNLDKIDEVERRENRVTTLRSVVLWVALMALISGGLGYAASKRQAEQALTSVGNQAAANNRQAPGWSGPVGGAVPTRTPAGYPPNGVAAGGCCGGGSASATGTAGGNIKWRNGGN